jgi:hypothetical protein
LVEDGNVTVVSVVDEPSKPKAPSSLPASAVKKLVVKKVTCARVRIFLNAYFPIEVREAGIVTVAREVPWNAYCPILISPSESITEVRVVILQNT